jgi:hypothetical protein
LWGRWVGDHPQEDLSQIWLNVREGNIILTTCYNLIFLWYFARNSLFFEKKKSQNDFLIFKKKNTTIANTMKACLRYSNYIFWILPIFLLNILIDDHHLNNITIYLQKPLWTFLGAQTTYLCLKKRLHICLWSKGSLFCFVCHGEISQTMTFHAVVIVSLESWGALTSIDIVLSYGVKGIDYWTIFSMKTK